MRPAHTARLCAAYFAFAKYVGAFIYKFTLAYALRAYGSP